MGRLVIWLFGYLVGLVVGRFGGLNLFQDQNGNEVTPNLEDFVNEQSLGFFSHLGWAVGDFGIYRRPFCEWSDDDMFERFDVFVNGSVEHRVKGFSLLNDEAERYTFFLNKFR